MIDTDLDQAFRHRQRHQPLRRLPRNAERGGDLVLCVTGDIIEPSGARRVVQPVAAAILPGIHVLPPQTAAHRSGPLPVSQGTASCAIVNLKGNCLATHGRDFPADTIATRKAGRLRFRRQSPSVIAMVYLPAQTL